MKNKKITIILTLITMLVVIAVVFRLVLSTSKTSNIPPQTGQLPTPTPSFDTAKYVAMVNGTGIKRSVFDKRNTQREHFKLWLKEHKITSTSLDTPLIDTLIEEALASEFGNKAKIQPTEKEINTKYKLAIKSVGTEEKYLSKIKDIQGIEKEEILSQFRIELLEQKIQEKTKLPFTIWVSQQKAKAKIEKANNI